MDSDTLKAAREAIEEIYIDFNSLQEYLSDWPPEAQALMLAGIEAVAEHEPWPTKPDGTVDIAAWAETIGPWKGPWATVTAGHLHCYTQDKASVTTIVGPVHVMLDWDDRNNVVGFSGDPQKIANILAATAEQGCCEPDAPWVPCRRCGKALKTCEDDSGPCRRHTDGAESPSGWLCEACDDAATAEDPWKPSGADCDPALHMNPR